MKSLFHTGIKGMKWGVRNGPPYPIEPDYKSPNQLSLAMKKFKYKNFDRLMSPQEVAKTKQGSCHDQVMYECQQLKRMGFNPKCLFFMELNGKQGGMTHSLVFYKDKGKIVWFENAWSDMAGINVYNSIDEIKKQIISMHSKNKIGNNKDFPNLIFNEFDYKKHKEGETLGEFVDLCLD